MKISKVSSYINFASANNNPSVSSVETEKNHKKKEKIIKYTAAAAAVAAITIGSIYYLKKHGKIKENIPLKSEKTISNETIKPEIQPVPQKIPDANQTVVPKNISDTKSKKPFVLDEKYSDFSRIKGKRTADDVIQEIENGIVKREFAFI